MRASGRVFEASWTCEYLSMNIRALGTFESPRWIKDEPTHGPPLVWVEWRSWCIARDVRGAFWTLCKPCPVSRCSYGLDERSRSSSARYHSRNMSLAISRHSVRDCSTNAYLEWRTHQGCGPWGERTQTVRHRTTTWALAKALRRRDTSTWAVGRMRTASGASG